ncbi:MAG: glycogen/starch/alpha-glucan phosphorylase [bacterium]|nr:glycogen/starch/alpha-glucan phosphorylase [bacterium]
MAEETNAPQAPEETPIQADDTPKAAPAAVAKSKSPTLNPVSSMSPNASFEEKVEAFKANFRTRMNLTLGRGLNAASKRDQFMALAYTVRDEMIDKWIKTQDRYYESNPKRVYYLSLEFLMGRTMGNALLNLGMIEVARKALADLEMDLDLLEEYEKDAGLGNGGLGRLAACFLDSMATLDLPAYGYGIRYEYGMFNQTIENLKQVEHPDNWLHDGNPWEISRTEDSYEVHFGGRITAFRNISDQYRDVWEEGERVNAVSYDMPIPGYQTDTVNTLKLWSAYSTESFNLETFNEGNYIDAIVDKHQSEVISKVLYPNDKSYQGKELRLKQQYFMVSASLQDIIHRLEKCGDTVHNLPNKVAIQLNDTHPSIAIPELMRILLDQYNFGWDDAWEITTNTFAYTNHTVLPEALEAWPVPLIEKILPRHIRIIYEINQRFLDQVAAYFPGDFDRRARMSIVSEGEPQQIRMAHLAIVGSYSVNGVAELHSKLLMTGIFKDFYELYPGKFNNKTNGITPRRWLKHCNPLLSDLITKKIGSAWVKDLDELRRLESCADDPDFQEAWRKVKRKNKAALGKLIHDITNVVVETDSIFDVQIKRVHEYKRQLLNILNVIAMYNRIKDGDTENFVPRTVIFGGKAAPGYYRAKEIIHLINAVGNLVNRDRRVGRLLKVVFLPNYGVSLAERIFPGSDLSEQISTAGMEASGTGNMKFALNGALTIGTLDGANVEIKEEVGDENIYIFGLTEEEVRQTRATGYDPNRFIEEDWELKRVLQQIRDGYFSPNKPDQFMDIYNAVTHEGDHFMVAADFRAYADCQERLAQAYRNQALWTKMSILNVARIGKFSSDRVIGQYAQEIWGVDPSLPQ